MFRWAAQPLFSPLHNGRACKSWKITAGCCRPQDGSQGAFVGNGYLDGLLLPKNLVIRLQAKVVIQGSWLTGCDFLKANQCGSDARLSWAATDLVYTSQGLLYSFNARYTLVVVLDTSVWLLIRPVFLTFLIKHILTFSGITTKPS